MGSIKLWCKRKWREGAIDWVKERRGYAVSGGAARKRERYALWEMIRLRQRSETIRFISNSSFLRQKVRGFHIGEIQQAGEGWKAKERKAMIESGGEMSKGRKRAQTERKKHRCWQLWKPGGAQCCTPCLLSETRTSQWEQLSAPCVTHCLYLLPAIIH